MIAKFKLEIEGFQDKLLFISIEKKWNGNFQLLFRKKLRNQACQVASYLPAYLVYDFGEEALKMFLPDQQILAKVVIWDNNNKLLYLVEKEAHNTFDKKSFI